MPRARTSGLQPQSIKHSEHGGDLERAARLRREADLALSMSERLARVHQLSKQMSAVKGAARR